MRWRIAACGYQGALMVQTTTDSETAGDAVNITVRVRGRCRHVEAEIGGRRSVQAPRSLSSWRAWTRPQASHLSTSTHTPKVQALFKRNTGIMLLLLLR